MPASTGSKIQKSWNLKLLMFKRMKSGFCCKRFAQSAGPGSEKARLLELFFTIGELSGVIFGSFSIIGSTLGALGAHFLITKAV